MKKVYEEIINKFNNGEYSLNYLQNLLSAEVKKANSYISRANKQNFTSQAIDSAIFYNQVMFNKNRFTSKQNLDRDEKLNELIQIFEFLSSPFKSKKESQEIVKKVQSDFNRSWVNNNITVSSGFAEWVAKGNLSELIGAVGNSPEVVKDIESIITSDTTYEDLQKAFGDFVSGNAGYDTALNNLRLSQSGN